MGDLLRFLESPPGVFALIIAAAGLLLAAVKFYIDWKDRHRRLEQEHPGVRAKINNSLSVDGWRIVQLHLTRPEVHKRHDDYNGWCIASVRLIKPRRARLAFARDDDASMRGPIRLESQRSISGRLPGQPQRFALEFFIKFAGTPHDRAARACFKVEMSRSEPPASMMLYAWAEVPSTALMQ
jgi:hypothetical protein